MKRRVALPVRIWRRARWQIRRQRRRLQTIVRDAAPSSVVRESFARYLASEPESRLRALEPEWRGYVRTDGKYFRFSCMHGSDQRGSFIRVRAQQIPALLPHYLRAKLRKTLAAVLKSWAFSVAVELLLAAGLVGGLHYLLDPIKAWRAIGTAVVLTGGWVAIRRLIFEESVDAALRFGPYRSRARGVVHGGWRRLLAVYLHGVMGRGRFQARLAERHPPTNVDMWSDSGNLRAFSDELKIRYRESRRWPSPLGFVLVVVGNIIVLATVLVR